MNPDSPLEEESYAVCAHCHKYRQIFRLTLAGWICKYCAEQIDAEIDLGPLLEL